MTQLPDSIRLDGPGIEYRFARSLGVGGVGRAELLAAQPLATRAADAFAALLESGTTVGLDEPVWWPRFEDTPASAAALAWAGELEAEALISIGIGGSYLGNRVLRDALLGPHYNARGDRGGPELWFAGYHLDPLELRDLVARLRARARTAADPFRVELLAISKSGTTTETLATTLALLEALEGTPGLKVGLSALTAPTSVLAELAAARGGSHLPFPEGIGGRWCVLTPVGLSTAAATGVDVAALLAGARETRDALIAAGNDLARNPALLYALLHHLHGKAGRTQAVFMPYGERLRCVAEWYVQLLAESLGKEHDRAGGTVHCGRTPIVAVGSTDMHAQTQLHQAGPQDKTVTTLDVRDWGEVTVDRVPQLAEAKRLAGHTIAALNTLAREANEEALFGAGRPSDAFVLDRLDARAVGGLLALLMATVAYEGELLDVCAYDQPGVEAYKAIMRARL
ncbi:MAG: glucose-6-phosphate isomerase [Planctomycetes bacterium]|nr:glucose-6-phosphate isomerase [Planctomycetota bacterium]